MISSNNISITHLHKSFGYCKKSIKESKITAYHVDLENYVIKKAICYFLKVTSEIGGVLHE